MLTKPQIMARGIAVAINRMLAAEINPFTVTAEDAFMFLCLGDGIIARWACGQLREVEYNQWCRMFRTWQACRKMTVYH